MPHPSNGGLGLSPAPVTPTGISPTQGAQEAIIFAPPTAPPTAQPVPRQRPAPTIQTRTEAVAGRRSAAGDVPQFKDNPIEAIGFVLQSIAAGFEGREQPSVKARAAAQQARTLAQNMIGIKINAMKFADEKCGAMKGEERAECIASIANIVSDLDPDFASNLEATIALPKALDFAKLVDHPAAIEFLEGSFDNEQDAFDFAVSAQGQKILQRVKDKADRPELEAKLDEIFPAIAGIVPDDQRSEMGITSSMISRLSRQGKLPARYELNENMLDMLDRFPEMLDERARIHGFATADELEAKGLVEAKLPSLERVEAVEKAKALGKAAVEVEPAVTTAQTSEMRKLAVLAAGGVYDPVTEQIKGLTLEKAREALDVIARAEKLLGADIADTPAVAVQMARNQITGALLKEDVEKAEDLSPVRTLIRGKRLPELWQNSAIGRGLRRVGRAIIGTLAEVFGGNMFEFPELSELDAGLDLFRTSLLDSLRVEGTRLKLASELIVGLVPSSYSLIQTKKDAEDTFKTIALKLNELRFEAETISNDAAVPSKERSEARVLAKTLPGLIDDLYVTVLTREELDKLPVGTTALILSEGVFMTRVD